MKRKISFILSFIIVFLTTIQFSYINSFAVEYNPNDTDLKWYDYIDETIYYMFSQFGCCLTNDKEQWTSNRDAYVELLKNGHYSYNSDGSLTFSEDTVESFKELLDSSLVSGGSSALGFIYVTPTCSPTMFASLLPVSAYKDFYAHCTYGVTASYVFNGVNYSYGTADISHYYYVGESTFIRSFYDCNGDPVSYDSIPAYYYHYDSSTSSGSVTVDANLNNIQRNYVYFSNGYKCIFSNSPIKVFLSYSALLRYLNGQAYMYVGTPVYNGGDMTIPASIVNGTSNPMNIYNNITNRIISSDDKSDETITAIIDDETKKYFEEISSAIGDIDSNTEESNSWLEKIYGKVTDIDDVIAEQFNQLLDAITQGFSDVTNGLSDLSFDITVNNDGDGDSDDSSGSDKKSFWEKLGELPAKLITGVLSLISKLVFKALDGLAYLSKIVVDKTVSVFEGIGDYFDRYTALFPEDSLIMNLSAVLPDELTDIIVLLIFGAVAVGIITIVKR